MGFTEKVGQGWIWGCGWGGEQRRHPRPKEQCVLTQALKAGGQGQSGGEGEAGALEQDSEFQAGNWDVGARAGNRGGNTESREELQGVFSGKKMAH